MKIMISLLFSVLLILPGPSFLLLQPLQSEDVVFILKPINVSGDLPSFYAIDIPWHYQELGYSCGPACLKMVFGCHGWNINESEIRNVCNTTLLHGGTIITDLVRAAHFSNASNSCGTPSIQGYSNKWYGCDSVSLMWSGTSDDELDVISTDLKHLLVQEKTLILLMWYTKLKNYGHYRVLRGYDDREDVFIFADPLGVNAYSGSHWNTTYETLYTEYWDFLPYYAQIVSPWAISMSFLQAPSPGSEFEVKAIIDAGVMQDWRTYPLSEVTAELTLPSGYSLVSGNKEIDVQLDSIGQGELTWLVNTPDHIHDSDSLSIITSGSFSAASYSYETYADIIAAEASLSVADGDPPSISDLTMVAIDDAVQFTVSVIDENELSNVDLQWRKSATNWSSLVMNHSGDGVWETSQDIPFLKNNETIQARVFAKDKYNNTAETAVFVSTQVSTPDTTTLIVVGIVLVIMIIAVVIIIRKKSH